jgi:hypothetical protein
LNTNKLIPVSIEDVDPPFRFIGLQTARLQGWDGAESFPEFSKLVSDIKLKISSPSIKPRKGEPDGSADKGERKLVIHPKYHSPIHLDCRYNYRYWGSWADIF